MELRYVAGVVDEEEVLTLTVSFCSSVYSVPDAVLSIGDRVFTYIAYPPPRLPQTPKDISPRGQIPAESADLLSRRQHYPDALPFSVDSDEARMTAVGKCHADIEESLLEGGVVVQRGAIGAPE